MPLDNSTAWAKEQILSMNSAQKVTPFFNILANDQNSLHISHIKGGSGITIIYCVRYILCPRS